MPEKTNHPGKGSSPCILNQAANIVLLEELKSAHFLVRQGASAILN